MKKLYSLFAAVAFSAAVFAQTTIYSENMGTATATTPIASNTFQNGAPIAYSGNVDVRPSNASTGYANASGGANVMVNTASKYFTISGIDTKKYVDLVLSFGQRKGTNAASNDLVVEVSENGTDWTKLSYTRPTGSGTSTWAIVTPTGTIPSTETLSIRFTGTTTTEWRIDDITLTGNLDTSLSVGDVSSKKVQLVKNTMVTNELVFAAKSEVKIINMNGQVVITASVNEGTTIDVSSLSNGIYLVSGVVNGKALTQKVIKK